MCTSSCHMDQFYLSNFILPIFVVGLAELAARLSFRLFLIFNFLSHRIYQKRSLLKFYQILYHNFPFYLNYYIKNYCQFNRKLDYFEKCYQKFNLNYYLNYNLKFYQLNYQNNNQPSNQSSNFTNFTKKFKMDNACSLLFYNYNRRNVFNFRTFIQCLLLFLFFHSFILSNHKVNGQSPANDQQPFGKFSLFFV